MISLNAIYGGAPYGAEEARQDECDEPPVITERERSRAWKRRYLHTLYRETLPDYREPTSDWMRQFSRRTLLNIWENYRNA